MIYKEYGDPKGLQSSFFLNFPDNGLTNPDVFKPKTFCIPWGIIPQNFNSLGFAELGNIQTHRLTH